MSHYLSTMQCNMHTYDICTLGLQQGYPYPVSLALFPPSVRLIYV